MPTDAYARLGLLIDGEWITSGRDTRPVINPATGETMATLPLATSADIDRAADAAARAWPQWRARSAFERSGIMRRAAQLIRERADALALVMTLEQGKPLREALVEINGTAEILEWNAEEARRLYGRVIPSRTPGVRWMVTREPVGPVAAFTPWNFPALTPMRKISGALAAGCSIVIKPAEETPGTVLGLAQAFIDAGLPPGVLNVVYGDPAQVSGQLIGSDLIRKVTFTGSTPVGSELARLAAINGVKRCTLELGGHAPVLVCSDADIGKAIEISVAGKFRNAGQVCVSPTRFYVHDSVHDRFVDGFAEAARKIRIGDGRDAETGMGPLANPRRVSAMESLVADATARGARLVTGGNRIGNHGYFYEPTVLADVPHDAEIMNTEPFGPVMVTHRFTELPEALRFANRLPFGLAAYGFTTSTANAQMLADGIESGMVGINGMTISLAETPFGGIKHSGYGSEGGTEGVDSYLVTKFVSQS